jgi:hypothetical protein
MIMRYLIYIFFLCIVSFEVNSQALSQNPSGKVSFISPQNVYVRFKTTEGISRGDTLFMISNGRLTPVMIVNNLSSTSCVCTLLTSKNVNVSQDILVKRNIKTPKSENQGVEKTIPEKIIKKDTRPSLLQDSSKKLPNPSNLKQRINGSISAYSYMNFSNTIAKNSTQLRYNYTLDARNMGGSKFSVENYITFRHKLGDWSLVKSDIFNALKVYTFAVKYEPDKSTRITFGRTINYKISSIGAMDGLQVEKTFNKISFGILAGTRPDYNDYGFNSKLLQYGGYLSFDAKNEDSFSQSSLAFMEQMNNMKTDRRFLYFQHSNSLLKNIYFFSTFEIDLYRVRLFVPQNTFDLTSFYLSLRYRITRNLSITGSYDQRKNVLFYETYKSLLDSVYQNERRQSLRVQANYRITQNLTLGLESGYRFLKSDPHPSRNFYGYISYSQVPGLKVTITLTGTYLESAFMNGKVLGGDITKDFITGKLQTSLGFRHEDYSLPESQQNIRQNIGEMNVYYQITRKLSFSVNYEGTFEIHDKYNRVYLQIRKRF